MYGIKSGQWSYSFNGEEFHGNSDTREGIIEIAKDAAEDLGIDDLEIIYLGRVKEFTFTVMIDRVLDQVVEDAYSAVGDLASGFLEDVKDEDEKELEDKVNELVREWINCKYKPNFWEIEDVEEVRFK